MEVNSFSEKILANTDETDLNMKSLFAKLRNYDILTTGGIDMTIGGIIRNRRLEMGMTQEELAKIVGTTKATISRWESGDIHKMKSSMVMAVSRALNISPLVFLQEEEVLLPDESSIINAYRAADEGTKSAVRKLLDVQEPKKENLHVG